MFCQSVMVSFGDFYRHVAAQYSHIFVQELGRNQGYDWIVAKNSSSAGRSILGKVFHWFAKVRCTVIISQSMLSLLTCGQLH